MDIFRSEKFKALFPLLAGVVVTAGWVVAGIMGVWATEPLAHGQPFVERGLPLAVKALAIAGGFITTTLALLVGLSRSRAVATYRGAGQTVPMFAMAKYVAYSAVFLLASGLALETFSVESLGGVVPWIAPVWFGVGTFALFGFVRVLRLLFEILILNEKS